VCSAATGGVITSGGGFSNTFASPYYQHQAVQHYLYSSGAVKPSADKFNSSGRAYPDIASYGTKFPIIMAGMIVPTAGTSASCPVIASIITLLNDLRLQNNQSSLGFINPLLYEIAQNHGEVFNDIVYGDNSCLLRDETCCSVGFHAAPGFDPATGLGSINYERIKHLIINKYKGKPKQWSYDAAVETNNNNEEIQQLFSFQSVLIYVPLFISFLSLSLTYFLFNQFNAVKSTLREKNNEVPNETSPLLP
jgi:hypothetical protein